MKYCTLEEFKQYQDINISDDDTLIENIISRAVSIIDKKLGYNLAVKEYTKRIDGWKNTIFLENMPKTVVSIKDTSWNEYEVDFIDGYIVYLEGKTPVGEKNIIITYTKGYESVPDDLKQVFLDFVRQLYLKQKSWDDKDISKKDIDWISITYTNDSEKQKRFNEVLQRYKSFSFFK